MTRTELRPRRPLLGTLALLLILTRTGVAQRPDPNAVSVTTADGETFSGSLESLDGTTLVLNDGRSRRFSLSDLQVADYPNRARASIRRGSLVLLATGDRIAASPTRSDEESLTAAWVKFSHWKPLTIPLDVVRAVVLRVPEVEAARGELLRIVTDPQLTSDLVVLENGDRLAGVIAEVGESTVTLDAEQGEVAVSRETVRAIAFNPELSSPPESDGPRALLALTDGSVLTVRDLSLQPGGLLTATSLFGAELEVPLAAVSSLRFLGGRVTDLSDLGPAEYEFTSYLGARRELAQDRSVGGNPLRLRGTEYDRGLGMHSRSQVTYQLGGQYRSFRARAGIDDETRGEGNVVFAVEVDGRRVYTSDPADGRAEPLTIGPIDLTGRDRLTLIVDFGESGDVLDHADWCDAVLVEPPRR